MTTKDINLVGKSMTFVYPDKDGKTVTYSFTLYADQKEAAKFDKFWNFLCSLAAANGMKDIPIHDYVKANEQ